VGLSMETLDVLSAATHYARLVALLHSFATGDITNGRENGNNFVTEPTL